MSKITFILLIALVFSAVPLGYAMGHNGLRPWCDDSRPEFLQRHSFQFSRMTTDTNQFWWVQNVTTMRVDDMRDGTYEDILKFTYYQANFYDSNRCAFTSVLMYSGGPGIWRPLVVYSEEEGGPGHRMGRRSEYPTYTAYADPDYIPYEFRLFPLVEFRSQVLAGDVMVNWVLPPGVDALPPGQRPTIYDETIRTIRPGEHAYYSLNQVRYNELGLPDLFTLPDWQWFHSHAGYMDMDRNPEVDAAFAAYFAGTLSVIQDPLAPPGENYQIYAYVSQTRDVSRPSVFHTIRNTETGEEHVEEGHTYLPSDMPMGAFADHYLKANH